MAYLNHLKIRNYSSRSIDIYGRSLKILVRYLNERGVSRVQDVTYDHLERFQLFLFNRNYAASSVHVFIRAARGFLRYLTKEGLLFFNPALDLILPRLVRNLQFIPSIDEVRRLLAAIDTKSLKGLRDRAMLETAYSCALRLSELAKMSLKSPDFEQGTLRVKGKGRKERLVPLGAKALLSLTEYLENVRPKLARGTDISYLWLSLREPLPITTGRIQQIVREYSNKAGLDPALSIHALRRACVTHMLKNGAHPYAIKDMLGHARIESLSPYLKVSGYDLTLMQKKARTGR